MGESKLKKNKLSLIFFILSALMFIVILVFITQALSYKPGKYTFKLVGYAGSFNRKAVKADKWPIEPYWMMHILGIFGMCILSFVRRKEEGIKGWQAIMTGILLAVFGYIGAKILFVIENFKYVSKNGLELSGVSFFGTVFFMPLAIPIIKRILFIKAKDMEYMDYCTPDGLLMLACIRLGCFMNGCCRGMVVWKNDKPLMYPVQFIECTLDLILLGVILLPVTQKFFKKGLYFIFMGGYGFIRFFLEFYRNTSKTGNLFISENDRQLQSDGELSKILSNGQIFALVCMVVCCCYISFFMYRRRKEKTGGNER